ncbi:mitochondrial oxidoreductase [Andalucia godoyi]|uniref:Mitochondrial oxidoreductase n=1 Tax=Andalucia godoyi TaxID=505711 RepID=A0A8K0AIR3_ANDGO|nr:mitochondrial oxidoreductase [Andalucia godoyi]|eukprot:ANDGO_02693.mRNA.1 mitochondrial oxidoreductase
MKALVYGSTGAVGSRLLRVLCAHVPSDYSQVHAVVRRPTLATLSDLSTSVADGTLTESIVSDFSSVEALTSAVNAVSPDVVFCCLGSTIRKAGSKEEFVKQDHDAIVNAAKASKACPSVKQFSLISSSGADAASSFFYLKIKGQIEKAVSELAFGQTDIFRPGMITKANRTERRTAEKFTEHVMLPLTSWMLRGPFGKYAPNTAENIAVALHARAVQVHAAQSEQEQKGAAIDIFLANQINEIAKKYKST